MNGDFKALIYSITFYPHRVIILLLPAPLPISPSLCSTLYVAASCWAYWLSDLEHRLVNTVQGYNRIRDASIRN